MMPVRDVKAHDFQSTHRVRPQVLTKHVRQGHRPVGTDETPGQSTRNLVLMQLGREPDIVEHILEAGDILAIGRRREFPVMLSFRFPVLRVVVWLVIIAVIACSAC